MPVAILLLLSFAALPSRGETAAEDVVLERVDTVTFHSRAIGKTRQYTVLRPRGYDAHARGWPLLVFLHGRGRHERSLIEAPAALEALAEAPFLIMLPDGDDGWYIDSPVHLDERYESYMAELLAHVAQRYRVSADRRKRGLAGWSMGGYGSVRLAQQWHDQFGAVASIIGLLDFPRDDWPGEPPYPVPDDRFGRDPEVHRTLNPIHHIARLKDTAILLITAESSFDRVMNENFRLALREQQIRHEWRMLKGGHTFEVVCESIPIVVQFMAAQFRAEP